MIARLGYVNTVNVVSSKSTSRRSGSGGGSSGSRWRRRGGMPSFVAAGAPNGSSAATTGGGGASTKVAEQLRAQLSQLQMEAEATRSKAYTARLRLLRLSEAAEKLRRQAALYIQNGKENEAGELLLQKKKVMQALDRAKSRIELLDKLLAKLNEAISLKETQLIGNLTLLSEVSTEDADQAIHIISPRDDVGEDSKTSAFDCSSIPTLGGTEKMECHSSRADKPGEDLQPVDKGAPILSSIVGDDKSNILKEMSSFNNFMEHIDEHLREIETDLVTLLEFSTLVLESEQMQKNSKVQQASQILEDVCKIRRRIAGIIQSKTEETKA